MGEAVTRHSLRPHFSRAWYQHSSGEFRRENVDSCLEKVVGHKLGGHHPRKRVIQYAAAHRLKR
jgi:hypothetical protein